MYKNGFKWKYYLKEIEGQGFKIEIDPKVQFRYDKTYRMLNSYIKYIESNFLHHVYYLYECSYKVSHTFEYDSQIEHNTDQYYVQIFEIGFKFRNSCGLCRKSEKRYGL